MKIKSNKPEVEKAIKTEAKDQEERFIGNIRNKTEIKETYNEQDPSLNDFYTTYDETIVTERDKKRHEKFMASLSEEEKKLLESSSNFYEIQFTNIGGLVSPIILEFEFDFQVLSSRASTFCSYNDEDLALDATT